MRAGMADWWQKVRGALVFGTDARSSDRMAVPDPSLREFLRSYPTGVATQMSGPIGVGFAIWGAFHKDTWDGWLLLTLAFVCACVCSYGFWKDERLKRIQSENALASLRAETLPRLGFVGEALADFMHADWKRTGEYIQGRTIVRNLSTTRSAREVQAWLTRVTRLDQAGNPVVDGLPRSLIADPRRPDVNIPPNGMHGFRLCEANWQSEAIELELAPESTEGTLSILPPGRYELRVIVSGEDIAPVTQEYVADTRGAQFSFGPKRPQAT